jgi:hypothetical protein
MKESIADMHLALGVDSCVHLELKDIGDAYNNTG